MPIRREYIADLYRNVLGRPEGGWTENEITGHVNNPGGEAGLLEFFKGSKEYTDQFGGTQTWKDVGGQVQPYATPISTPQTPPPTFTSTPPPSGGYTSGGVVNAPPGSLSSFIPPPDDALTRAKTGLANVYRQFLGRDPGPGDVDKWLSGGFGYGTGVQDYDKFVAAIMGSPDARGYRPKAPTDPNSRSLEYWQSRGVPAVNIFDPTTGQLRSGWKRTANGYEPTSYTGFTGQGDYSAFDTQRQQDPTRSAKDAFAWISGNSPSPPLHDRRALPTWFNTYIRPTFEAMGNRVISVSEDGFTYSNHDGTFFVDYAQNAGAASGSMQQRLQWNATPADAATWQKYPGDTGGTGTGGSGTGGSTTQRTTDGIANLYRQLGQTYAPPGGPGVFNGPVQQVGQDPLSQLITGGLADLVLNQGATSDGRATMDRLNALIDSGGYLPDTGARGRRFESARELMAKGERTALNDARGALASRGLLSEPGTPSGAESSTIGRIQTRNAEEFARNLRDIGIAEDDAANTRLTNALGLATGMATDQARTMLATLGAGSDRQNMLAQIALESLQTNMAWNQFLAQFGLERDKAMYAIQSGNIDSLMPYLALFLQLAQTTTRGFV